MSDTNHFRIFNCLVIAQLLFGGFIGLSVAKKNAGEFGLFNVNFGFIFGIFGSRGSGAS